MKKILFPILALILFACSSNIPAPEPINVTVISQMTVTLTATLTPTSTVMPTITFTPKPEITLPAEIVTSVETTLPGFKVSGDGLKDKSGNNVPDLKIAASEDGKTWTGSMPPYEFAFDGETYKIPYATTLKPEEITVTADGTLCVPARCNKESGWERKMVQFPGIDGKVESGPLLEVSSVEEVNLEIAATAGIATPEERGTTNKDVNLIADKLLGRKIFGNRKVYLTYGGMFSAVYTNYAFSDNVLEIRDEKTEKLTMLDVSTYLVTTIGKDGQYALVGWRAGGKEFVRVVDKSGLNDPKQFNSYFNNNEPKW